MKNWITKSSKIVYKNSRFSIREDQVIRPDGTDGVYHVMDRPSVVVIVPITKNGKIYFIRINRYTTKKNDGNFRQVRLIIRMNFWLQKESSKRKLV